MKILFLTCRFPTKGDHYTLEKELVYVFNRNGHKCSVINILEKKYNKKTFIEKIETASDNAIDVLHVKTGNLFNNLSFFEKKITILSLGYIIPKAIRMHFPNENFDYIIAYGPYLCSSSIIKPLKKFYNCKALLIQWDIFPQNAYDLGIIRNKLIFEFLKYRQKSMLALYDLILCNSNGNIKYFEQHFAKQTQNKLFLFYNCESKINYNIDQTKDTEQSKEKLRQSLDFAHDDLVLLFGGNIGIPQELENIIQLADNLKDRKNIKFIIIGQGTEAQRIKSLCKNKPNINFLDFLASADYEQLLKICDIGIVSLSKKFTVPNFPAKVTSYLKNGLPILACIDNTAYLDLGEFINENQIGYCIKASEVSNVDEIESLLLDRTKLNLFRNNTKVIFDKYFDIDKNYFLLINKIKEIIA